MNVLYLEFLLPLNIIWLKISNLIISYTKVSVNLHLLPIADILIKFQTLCLSIDYKNLQLFLRLITWSIYHLYSYRGLNIVYLHFIIPNIIQELLDNYPFHTKFFHKSTKFLYVWVWFYKIIKSCHKQSLNDYVSHFLHILDNSN